MGLTRLLWSVYCKSKEIDQGIEWLKREKRAERERERKGKGFLSGIYKIFCLMLHKLTHFAHFLNRKYVVILLLSGWMYRPWQENSQRGLSWMPLKDPAFHISLPDYHDIRKGNALGPPFGARCFTLFYFSSWMKTILHRNNPTQFNTDSRDLPALLLLSQANDRYLRDTAFWRTLLRQYFKENLVRILASFCLIRILTSYCRSMGAMYWWRYCALHNGSRHRVCCGRLRWQARHGADYSWHCAWNANTPPRIFDNRSQRKGKEPAACKDGRGMHSIIVLKEGLQLAEVFHFSFFFLRYQMMNFIQNGIAGMNAKKRDKRTEKKNNSCMTCISNSNSLIKSKQPTNPWYQPSPHL